MPLGATARHRDTAQVARPAVVSACVGGGAGTLRHGAARGRRGTALTSAGGRHGPPGRERRGTGRDRGPTAHSLRLSSPARATLPSDAAYDGRLAAGMPPRADRRGHPPGGRAYRGHRAGPRPRAVGHRRRADRAVVHRLEQRRPRRGARRRRGATVQGGCRRRGECPDGTRRGRGRPGALSAALPRLRPARRRCPSRRGRRRLGVQPGVEGHTAVLAAVRRRDSPRCPPS